MTYKYCFMLQPKKIIFMQVKVTTDVMSIKIKFVIGSFFTCFIAPKTFVVYSTMNIICLQHQAHS